MTALVPESFTGSYLGKQHIVHSIDLMTREVMIVKKYRQVMDVVPPLQLAIGNVQKPAGEISGMSMTCGTAVVPEPVQIQAGGAD